MSGLAQQERIVPASAADVDFLWTMLTLAASMPAHDDASVAGAKADPSLASHVLGWGRAGDTGVVAWWGDERVGAAWARLAVGPVPYKVATATEPELAIASLPRSRGQGLGTRLLAALHATCAGRFDALRLSVREGNPAVHLYERASYVVIDRMPNRVGGVSLVMRRAL